MRKEIFRKLFHLLGLVYLAGLLWLPRASFLLIFGGIFLMGFVVELIRLKNPKFNQSVIKIFSPLIRAKEEKTFSGAFWMLLGVLVTAILLPSPYLAATALLYLLLGDGVASLAGKFFQGPKWVGTKKRLSGSLACFLVCSLIGIFLLKSQGRWDMIIGGALTATLAEVGWIPINDNFMIPVLSAGTFLLLLI